MKDYATGISSGRSGSRAKIFRLQLDRRAVRCAICRVVPGVAIAPERFERSYALGGNQPLQCSEPMPVIGLAGVGIACRLRPLDLAAERLGPFRPGEHATLMQ